VHTIPSRCRVLESVTLTLSEKNNMKILAIANILGWAMFILIDKAWHNVISEAVSAGQKTYGEMFGPLSFFRPLALYGSLLITMTLSCAVIINYKTKKQR